ncbi:MAG: cystathionine beta-lyase [Pseudomonadota bacterium]
MGCRCRPSGGNGSMKHPSTRFAHLGRPEPGLATPVNPALERASTLLFEKSEDLYRTDIRGYGRHGSNVHDALCELFTALEGGATTQLYPSGVMACTQPALAFLSPGDHVLLTDSAYGPTRYFCQTYLKQIGVETELFDPRAGAEIERLFRDETKVVLLESPGSLTFEIQDIPAISHAARQRGIVTIVDNTWSAGLTCNPLALGADISTHSATKYFGGHGDLLFGAAICASEDDGARVAAVARQMGVASSPDDAYQVLRGFRTVTTRFAQQESTALELAQYLSGHSKVLDVLHPALATHTDHHLWTRDFNGSGCLFGFVLQPCSNETVNAFIDALDLFGIGYSYGGYESLAIHCDPQLKRQFGDPLGGPLIRLACGLEHPNDLKNDLEQAFARIP